MTRAGSRTDARRLLRYLVAGGLNTGTTWLLYLALLRVVPYAAAYSLSFAAGIVLSFVLNSRFVFGVPLRWSRLIPYPGVYLVQYVLGLAVVWVVVERARLPAWSAPLIALALTVPIGFVLTRRILVGGGAGQPPRAA